jgi:hypothetical protein
MVNIFASGKAMPLHTLVKTPGGWTRLGDLKIGDQVIGPKGNVANITNCFPQGVTECFRFTLEDGRTADSHPLHLWQVHEAEPSAQGYVTTTQDIVGHFDQFCYYLPVVGEVGGTSIATVGLDRDLHQLAASLVSSGIVIDNPVMELSYGDRYALAERMIELSGVHISERGVSVLMENQTGAANFKELMWSLGGVATLDPYEALYRVEFKHRDIVGLVDGLLGDSLGSIIDLSLYEDVKLKIVSFEQLKPMETACISIDGEDSLYIIDDWVVTHNSFS